MSEFTPPPNTEWDPRLKQLTLTERRELPSMLDRITGDFISSNVRIENCLPDETPSYETILVVRADTEQKARQHIRLEDVFQNKISNGALTFQELPGNQDLGEVVGGQVIIGGNVIIGGSTGRVIINGVDISEQLAGQQPDVSIRKKEVIIRIPKEKAHEINLTNRAGDIILASLEGRGRIFTSSGTVVAELLKGNFNVRTQSGDIRLRRTEGTLKLNTQSGDVTINNGEGKCEISVQSGDVYLRDILLSDDSTINSMSGNITIGVSNRDLAIRIQTMSGDINLPKDGFTIQHDSRRRNMGGGGSFINVNGRYVTVISSGRSTSGTVEGYLGDENNNQPMLIIETMSGDVDVESTGKNLNIPTNQKK